ncbi:unnamed protein product [Didymodactylos carnosus]|uniref:G-protein coupled receptors family 1 profile domain-containing protein n=1 Tax=Didymodactylos carnosus TaxID=1234261 RepID=A0A813YJE9_9BILA|nr:unnamed protein product [Didymodactylos carnosus]CAF0885149.1 unnamed protein product [Didymodactylos carnosus]CAF3553162.1 unnamed protein product [Didymodactylos carnosus]CAF3670575.1 unnamed protein product [Didymodactylos carnosus]
MNLSDKYQVNIDDVHLDLLDIERTLQTSFIRDTFEHYVNGICGVLFCILGIISNALSFSVLIRRTMKLSTYVYLAGLCLSDFTACICLLPICLLDAYPISIFEYELPKTYSILRFLIITGVISTTARAVSVWLCFAFTICQPFIGPQYCTMKNARYVTFFIYILGLLYALPLLFEYEPVEVVLFDMEKKFYRQQLTKLGRNGTFRWIYVTINSCGVYIIPLITIAILNRQLLTAIRLLEKRSEEIKAPLPSKQGVTIMLIATTVCLVLFRLPLLLLSILWLVKANLFFADKTKLPLRRFHTVANTAAVFNAATSFILFIVYGTKFRSEFTKIYCCCFNKKSKSKIKNNRQYNGVEQKLLQDGLNNMNNNGRIVYSGRKRNSSGVTTTSVLKRTSTTTMSTTSISSCKKFRRKHKRRLTDDNSNTNNNHQAHYNKPMNEDANNHTNNNQNKKSEINCDKCAQNHD